MGICRHFVKIIFPFRYDITGNTRLELVRLQDDNGKERTIFQKFKLKNSDLRHGLPEVFADNDNSSQIVKCYRVDGNNRFFFGLPQRKDEYLKFHCRAANLTEQYDVAIPEVNIYLFETGVGLAELECKYHSTNISDYMNCNYFISEIKSEKNYFIAQFKKRASKDEEYVITEKRFSVRELLGKVLTYVPGARDFYTEKNKDNLSQKGLLYAHLYLDKEPEDLKGLLFNLRNNYKRSYLAPRGVEIEDDVAIHIPFKNCYWASSYNAVVNVCIETDNEETNEFYSKELISRLEGVYHLLYLAVLHQRFAIMHLMEKMGELDRLIEDYETMRMQLAVTRQYLAESANMKFRVFFKYPSYVEHVNDFYDFLHSTYSIDALYEHCSSDLGNLEGICNIYVERIRTREEQLKKCKTAKIEIFVGIFGTIVGAISLLNDSWELLEKVFGVTIDRFSWPVWTLTILLWLPSLLVFVDAEKQYQEIKKTKAEIEIADMKYPTIEDVRDLKDRKKNKKNPQK